MLLHEVMKHCRFPRLKYLGQRQIRGSKPIPYYKLDWSVFQSELPLPSLPAFQDEFKYCQYVLKQGDKNYLERQLADMVQMAVRDKIMASIDFEHTLVGGFLSMITKLCDCAYDLSVNFYYRKGRRNLLAFLLSWWILQENFGSPIVMKWVGCCRETLSDDIVDIKDTISQLPAESTERELHEDLLDILEEAVKAFAAYCNKFAETEEDDVKITD
jgi:hypothetical protein